MQTLKILNSREIKGIFGLIEKQWGCRPELDYAFLMNSQGKIYLSEKEVFSLDLKKIRVDTLGMYFGEMKNNELRLSIEGSQLVGPYAKKNVVELSDSDARNWIRGEDIEISLDHPAFVIIKNKKDFIGTGKCSEKSILNFVPKARRPMSAD